MWQLTGFIFVQLILGISSQNQKLTVETYTKDFRKTLSTDSGLYLWNDGSKDKCGQGFSKFCLESFEAT